MEPSRTIKPEPDKLKAVKLVAQFLVKHGEKIIAAVMIAIAFWIALRGFDHRPLSWQPNQLTELADDTETTIKKNRYTLADENLNVFDYAAYAEQIKERISPLPYRSDTAWRPVLRPDRPPRGSVEVLTAHALKVEALRRNNLLTVGRTLERWQRPALPNNPHLPQETVPIWVNLYGTIPLRQQWDIYNQTFDEAIAVNRPEYVFYELERAEINPKQESVWQPVIVYPDRSTPPEYEHLFSQNFPLHWDRLIPAGQQMNSSQSTLETSRDLGATLLFSDLHVEPAKTYAYRIRLYLANPNYNLQESLFEEGVDTKNRFIRSDWSTFARVYVPGLTTVRLASVSPTDTNWDFPRLQNPLGTMTGTVLLDYFDLELGHSLAPIEKRNVRRGMLCNMSREAVRQYIRNIGGAISLNYPESGLRSDVCVLDFSGGKKLQKRGSKEAQGTPDLFVPSKALLLMPDGTMQVVQAQ